MSSGSRSSLPKCSSTPPTMLITSEADPAAIDLQDAFSRAQPQFRPQIGFDLGRSIFLDENRILLTSNYYLCQVDLKDCRDDITFIDMKAWIASITVSLTFDLVAVCVNYRRSPTVFIKDAKNILITKKSFVVGAAASQMLITPDGNKIVLLEVGESQTMARITVYTIDEGKLFAEARTDLSGRSAVFEMSLCPADEDVICLLTDECINLYRIIPGQLIAFSEVKIPPTKCHAWADDVTLVFGGHDGKLLLYRESIPLGTVDLGTIHGRLILDAQKARRASVVRMHAADLGLLVCVEIGVVFIFPPARDEEEGFDRWKNSRAIVIESLNPESCCLQMGLDKLGIHFFYADTESLWLCNVQYAEAVCRDGMRLVIAQHVAAVKSISIDGQDSGTVVTIDSRGLIILTSGVTKWVLRLHSACPFRRLLATHVDEDVLAVCMARGGYRLLLMRKSAIHLYSILCGTIQPHSTIMEAVDGQEFLTMQPNSLNTMLAVLTSEAVYVLETKGFKSICSVTVGHKEEVVALRWAPDDSAIAILSNQDSVCLVDVRQGSLLWTVDFKLRFFVDVGCLGQTVFAMGNKFMMSRLENGKELEASNVHQEGISLNASSTTLLTTQKLHFVASSAGDVNKVAVENMEQGYLVACPDKHAVTTLYHDVHKDQLFVGFDDGRVICFNVVAENNNQPDDQAIYSEDFVLCPVATLQKYETELKDLRLQCHLIKMQSEGVLAEYREIKEKEIAELKTALESTLQAMREKMKKAEEKYEAIEASKEESFAKMKREMDEQVDSQKRYYEKLVSDQIKSSLEKEDVNQSRFDAQETDFKLKIDEMKAAFKKEEKKWSEREKSLIIEVKKSQHQIHKLERSIQFLVQKRGEEKKEFERKLAENKLKTAEEGKENVSQVKQLKAYLLREKEAREKADTEVADVRTELADTQDELDKCKEELDASNNMVVEERRKNADAARALDERSREMEAVVQKHKLLGVELDKEKNLRHAHQRRLKHFEMLIDEMSEHVYDHRRLEQSVLGLLAFFNSVPKSGQMLTLEQVQNHDKNQTAKTKSVIQLGTSRHKRH